MWGITMKLNMFFVFLTLFFIGKAEASDYELEICSNCYTDGQFAFAAEHYSLNTLPGFLGIHPVYVANPNSGVVRFFHVHWDEDWNFNPLGHGSEGRRSARPMHSGSYSGDGVANGFYVVEAIEASGDPAVIHAIEEGAILFQVAFDLLFSQVINSGDVDGLESVQSALALLGPEETTGPVRLSVTSRLTDHFNSIETGLLTAVSDTIVGAYKKFLVDSLLVEGHSIKLVFPDDTYVYIEISLRSIAGAPFEDHWKFELDLESVRGPGLDDGAPQGPWFFNNYNYQGPFGVAWQIMMLADRWADEDVGCSFSCPTDDYCIVSCKRP